MKFRKRPVVIDAVQLTWGTWGEVCDLIGKFPEGLRGCYQDWDGNFTDKFPGDKDGQMAKIAMRIPTLEGTMFATEGDWIIKGIKGEFYPCKHDIFQATYEPC